MKSGSRRAALPSAVSWYGADLALLHDPKQKLNRDGSVAGVNRIGRAGVIGGAVLAHGSRPSPTANPSRCTSNVEPARTRSLPIATVSFTAPASDGLLARPTRCSRCPSKLHSSTLPSSSTPSCTCVHECDLTGAKDPGALPAASPCPVTPTRASLDAVCSCEWIRARWIRAPERCQLCGRTARRTQHSRSGCCNRFFEAVALAGSAPRIIRPLPTPSAADEVTASVVPLARRVVRSMAPSSSKSNRRANTAPLVTTSNAPAVLHFPAEESRARTRHRLRPSTNPVAPSPYPRSAPVPASAPATTTPLSSTS